MKENQDTINTARCQQKSLQIATNPFIKKTELSNYLQYKKTQVFNCSLPK